MKMTQEQMNEHLNGKYESKIWATIMANNDVLMEYALKYGASAGSVGALTNEYCYIGLIEDRLDVVVLNNFSSKKEYEFSINLNDITKIKIKKSIIPNRRVLILYLNNNKEIKISIMNNAKGTNIKNQKENVNLLIEKLKKIR
ncbi:MAG: hypothetical protein E7157_00620 [Lactobacillales bacterium]|nr:hypothetical protein [Lactobacillales bacterium]